MSGTTSDFRRSLPQFLAVAVKNMVLLGNYNFAYYSLIQARINLCMRFTFLVIFSQCQTNMNRNRFQATE